MSADTSSNRALEVLYLIPLIAFNKCENIRLPRSLLLKPAAGYGRHPNDFLATFLSTWQRVLLLYTFAACETLASTQSVPTVSYLP